jgi:hypothetical protein
MQREVCRTNGLERDARQVLARLPLRNWQGVWYEWDQIGQRYNRRSNGWVEGRVVELIGPSKSGLNYLRESLEINMRRPEGPDRDRDVKKLRALLRRACRPVSRERRTAVLKELKMLCTVDTRFALPLAQ